MKMINSLMALLLVLGLSGCSKGAKVEEFKTTIGMSKEQVESLFGKPETSILDAADNHPGGYWVYRASSGASCKLHFDLPPRVVSVDC